MRLVLDSSVLIDQLRDERRASALLDGALRRGDELWSSYVVRVEVLVGVLPGEEQRTDRLFELIRWVEVDRAQADAAGELGRRFLRSHPGIDPTDLIVAALALQLEAKLMTLNVKHFPMFPGLKSAY